MPAGGITVCYGLILPSLAFGFLDIVFPCELMLLTVAGEWRPGGGWGAPGARYLRPSLAAGGRELKEGGVWVIFTLYFLSQIKSKRFRTFSLSLTPS